MGISKRFASTLFAVLILFAAAGCTKQEQTGSIVHFKEIDPQSGMEMTRMIVTPGYFHRFSGRCVLALGDITFISIQVNANRFILVYVTCQAPLLKVDFPGIT